MSSPTAQFDLVLTRRLDDGTIEWIPLESPRRLPVDPGASYTLIDRSGNYEAPAAMIVRREGDDLIVVVDATEALALSGFFEASDATFHPTTNIAGGAGPFSGEPLTPASRGAGAADDQTLWSAEAAGDAGAAMMSDSPGGESSAALWAGLAAGGLGIALAGAGGGSSGDGGPVSAADDLGAGTAGGGPVDDTAPTIDNVALSSASGALNGTLNAGDTISVTVAMSESTVVDTTAGTPQLALRVGDSTVFADYDSGSGTRDLVFTYLVRSGDRDRNGVSIEADAIELNGGTITDAAGNAADLNHSAVPDDPQYRVDTTVPTLLSSTPSDDDEEVPVDAKVELTFSEPVEVGSGTITISNGTDTRVIDVTDDSLVSISGATITIDPGAPLEPGSSYNVEIESGALIDAAGNSYEGFTNPTTLNFDTDAVPSVEEIALTGATGDQNNTLNAGDKVTVTVAMSELVEISGTPRVALTVGGVTVFADYISGAGSNSLSFEYRVEAGDTDDDGISIDDNAIDLNGGTITDAEGNVADLSHNAVADDRAFRVDTTPPSLTSTTPSDNAGNVAVDADIVLTFTEELRVGNGTVTLSDGTDSTTLDITDSSQLRVSGNALTIDPISDLKGDNSYSVRIDAGALTDTAGNGYAGINDTTTLNFQTATSADTSVVVFDLIQGASSRHSGRRFDGDLSYDIYIRVESNDAALSTAGEGPGTWGTWTGAAELGSDDRIILVGNGEAVRGPLLAVNRISVDDSRIAWSTSLRFDAGVLGEQSFCRATGFGGDDVDRVRLFDSPLPEDFLEGQGGSLETMYLTSMPAAILTSQGLL